MADLLFDTPWWLPTLLAGVGIVLFFNGNRRQEAQLRNIGLALAAAAAVLLTVSYLVDTPLEKAVKETSRLVRAIEAQDWNTLRSILDPNTSVSVMGAYQVYGTRDQIVDGAKRAYDRYGIKNVKIFSTDARRDDTLISINMTLLSDHDAIGRTINTNWDFEWQQSGDDWHLVRIINQKIGNLRGDRAGQQFPRPLP
jgi:hypothetical protein